MYREEVAILSKTKIAKSRVTKKGRNYLWALRMKVKYTVKEVSNKIGISVSMIYQNENNARSPSSKLAGKLADLYECTLDDVYNRNSTGKQESIKT
jgi:DNA-binding XRE family transcriptional regulator